MSSSPSAPGYALRQRRFAPLNPEKRGESDAPSLGGIVFDVDGTLWYFYLFYYVYLIYKSSMTNYKTVYPNTTCSLKCGMLIPELG